MTDHAPVAGTCCMLGHAWQATLLAATPFHTSQRRKLSSQLRLLAYSLVAHSWIVPVGLSLGGIAQHRSLPSVFLLSLLRLSTSALISLRGFHRHASG